MKHKVYDLDAMVEMARDHAERVLVKLHQRELLPIWLLIDKKGVPYVITSPWKDDEEKETMKYRLRQEMRKLGIVAYSFVVEAWMAVAKDLNDKSLMRIRPSLHPDRQEVVMAMATDGKEFRWRRWSIIRDYEERVIRLDEHEIKFEYDRMESWMANLLN